MITLQEMLHGHDIKDIPLDIQANMALLLIKVNVLRLRWGSPMKVTSGIRTPADQQIINPKKPHSNHLTGHAIDIYDKDLIITSWLKSEEGNAYLEELDLYCEEGNEDWIHIQDVPPKSGHRWFWP